MEQITGNFLHVLRVAHHGQIIKFFMRSSCRIHPVLSGRPCLGHPCLCAMDDYPRIRWSYCKGTCIVPTCNAIACSLFRPTWIWSSYGCGDCGRLLWTTSMDGQFELGPHQDMTGHLLPTRVPTKTWLDTSTQGQPIFLIRWSKRTAWMIFFFFS